MYWGGVRGTAQYILNLDTGWRWVVSFVTWPFYPWVKGPSTHLIGGWAGPRVSLDDAVVKRKFLPLPVIEPWLSSV